MLIEPLPAGVKLLSVTRHDDARGRLRAIEKSGPIPFVPVRMFLISDVPEGANRARHAVSCHEFLWIISGACTLEVDDGKNRVPLRLQGNGPGALVSAGVWMELRDFTADAVLSVLASERYEDTSYFPAPNPALIVRFE